jgi:uncharacterized protein
MKRLLVILAASLALVNAASARASEAPIPSAPTQWVTDNAEFLSADERDRLDSRLSQYESQTGHQVIVWIGTTTGDTPLEQWTIDAFTKWKVGRKQLDDGAALFLFASDRKVRIEVGYGLEGQLTDAQSSEIIRNVIIPKIKAGDNDGAVDDGITAMLGVIGGEAQATGSEEPTASSPSLLQMVGIGIVLILLLIFVIRNPGVAIWLLYTMASGRGGGGYGGGGGGGGGFSGGGGMGGGGGASGSW